MIWKGHPVTLGTRALLGSTSLVHVRMSPAFAGTGTFLDFVLFHSNSKHCAVEAVVLNSCRVLMLKFLVPGGMLRVQKRIFHPNCDRGGVTSVLLNEVGRQLERHTRGDQSAFFFGCVTSVD